MPGFGRVIHGCDPGGEERSREGGSLEDQWQVQLVDLIGVGGHDENPLRNVIDSYPCWNKRRQTADGEVQDGQA